MSTFVTSLGEDQIKWLNKYRNINLEQWRYIILENQPQWLYVGNWEDGDYHERQQNLERNRYYYWPRD